MEGNVVRFFVCLFLIPALESSAKAVVCVILSVG